MEVVRGSIHYGLHFIFPALVAYTCFFSRWKKVTFILLSTMLVDLDHLLTIPIFDPNRCSVGFHFLHSYPAIGLYTLVLLMPKIRIIAIGLLLHMATDFLDCLWV